MGCWRQSLVADPFNPERIPRVRFCGEVSIGRLDGEIVLPEGDCRPCGIYDSTICKCSIGDRVHISGVRLLAGYEVEEEVQLENVNRLVIVGESTRGPAFYRLLRLADQRGLDA